jgi:hypothetical protein
MGDIMKKIERFTDVLANMRDEAGVARYDAMINQGEALRQKAIGLGMRFDGLYVDRHIGERADTAKALAETWMEVQRNEQRKESPMLAFHVPTTGPEVLYLEPDMKTVTPQDIKITTLPEAFRSRSLWEALEVTMMRRAAEEYRDLCRHPKFKKRGLGVDKDQLVFVYTYWNEEHGQLCLYRLQVSEDDLPDLPATAEA